MTFRTIFTVLALCGAVLLALPATGLAASMSPVGYWKTVDDETGKPRSIVKIWMEGGKVNGKIIQLFRNPDELDDADPDCDECKGPLHNKKVIGLEILKDLTEDGSEWSGGEILDPANGEFYSCFIEVQEGGMKLKVRGYLGISLLGRTQYWYRVPKPDLDVRSFLLKPDGSLEILVYAEGAGPERLQQPKAAPEKSDAAPAEPAKTDEAPAAEGDAAPAPGK